MRDELRAAVGDIEPRLDHPKEVVGCFLELDSNDQTPRRVALDVTNSSGGRQTLKLQPH